MRLLHDLLADSAAKTPDAPAVDAPDGVMTYREIDRFANRIARELAALGVARGDRVGIWLEKSCQTVATMQAALRLGAAYVPIDPVSPTQRAAKIARGCGARVLVCAAGREHLGEELGVPCVDWVRVAAHQDAPHPRPAVGRGDLAYILYTSGSTGEPKGVCISHENALAFINWAVEELRKEAGDRLSNHAPFHFDLSVLDLYVAFAVGASVHLVPEAIAYLPGELVRFMVEHEITSWYSVPSALMLMLDHGDLEGARQQLDGLRTVLFAGEPFPVKHLRRMRRLFAEARLLNLYGPTETNVCTFYEVGEVAEERTTPVPIGGACSGDRVWAVDGDGNEVPVGGEGELLVSGPTVMLGYWGQEPHGTGPYHTGDMVRRLAEDEYEYVGRRDHMVKLRGYRIELGEIEAALLEHPAVAECAVLVHGAGISGKLFTFMVSAGEERPGLLALKQHCADRLPRYMIVDRARWLDEMPRTRNGKVDRKELARLLSGAGKTQ